MSRSVEPPKVISHSEPQRVLRAAVERFDHDRIAISFSGAEDVVLIDMAHRMNVELEVFSLDTGRLHPETYRYLETVRDHYQIKIELLMPEPDAIAQLVSNKGLFSFYKEGHGECCAIRKIEPLRRKLGSLDAWITGQRQDQSVTRVNVPLEQIDQAFSTNSRPLTKFNPLANWTSREIWSYIRQHSVPYNSLHDAGYVSIGCEPCTRPVGPHEPERAGRWWWEEATKKECGLHGENVVKIVG
ncbi:MAG: phosphoadenylyl-sulfate reductase, partial [Gammaproteobacteria bacterium]|nr:phosphoadenylyl-sulfate reductase [Gammaproteobacteria bacterium]